MKTVRDTLASLEGRLDDMRREHAWRAIAHTLDAQAYEPVSWRPRLFVAAASTLAVTFAIVIAVAITRRPTVASTPFAFDAIVAERSQHRTIERAGVTITVLGPGAATVADGDDGTLHVRVATGTLLAERAAGADPVTLFAGQAIMVARDHEFAVRVEGSHVVFGAGEHSREIVERDVVMSRARDERETRAPVLAASPPEPMHVSPARPTSPRRRAEADAPRTEPAPPVLRASELYRRAEAALATHDGTAARELLERLLREFPDDALVDAARYDLALLAHAAGDDARALALLDAIAARGGDRAVRTAAEALRRRLRP